LLFSQVGFPGLPGSFRKKRTRKNPPFLVGFLNMPFYDYRCDACGEYSEFRQRMYEGHKRKCPKCSKLKLKRVPTAGAGVIFKGSGFYETDYKKKNK